MTRPVTDITQYMSPLMLQSTHQVWRFLQGCLLKKMLKRQSPPMGNITSPRVSKNTALLLQHHYENDLLYSASDKQLQFLLISLNHGDKNVIATFAHIFKKLHCLKDWQRLHTMAQLHVPANLTQNRTYKVQGQNSEFATYFEGHFKYLRSQQEIISNSRMQTMFSCQVPQKYCKTALKFKKSSFHSNRYS